MNHVPATLRITLRLIDEANHTTIATDTEIVDLLPAVLPRFSRLVVGIPSVGEMPDAWQHPLTKRALSYGVALCGETVLRRDLWPKYNKDVFSDDAHVQADFYACAVRSVRIDARALTAEFGNEYRSSVEKEFYRIQSGLDIEPYGKKSPQEKIFTKTGILNEPLIAPIHDAIVTAISAAGRVDWITPIASSSPLHWNWLGSMLGINGICHKSYWMHRRTFNLPNVQPPFSRQYKPRVYSLMLMPDGYSDGKRCSMVGDFLAFTSADLARLQQTHPSYTDVGVYAPPDDTPAVLRQLGTRLLEVTP